VSHRRSLLIFAVTAATLLVALFAAAWWVGQLEAEPPVTNAVNRGSQATSAVIYAASIPDLQGRPQPLAQWSTQLLVINFWASWCAPCLEEIPMLVEAQSKYGQRGLQIVGIAADSSLNAGNFAKKLQINYPILVDESGAITFSKRVGNRLGLLPFTIVINPAGEIVMTKLGVFQKVELAELLEKQLPKG
jgi:thiol-disulfide isomerase/thioredoxin